MTTTEFGGTFDCKSVGTLSNSNYMSEYTAAFVHAHVDWCPLNLIATRTQTFCFFLGRRAQQTNNLLTMA